MLSRNFFDACLATALSLPRVHLLLIGALSAALCTVLVAHDTLLVPDEAAINTAQIENHFAHPPRSQNGNGLVTPTVLDTPAPAQTSPTADLPPLASEPTLSSLNQDTKPSTAKVEPLAQILAITPPPKPKPTSTQLIVKAGDTLDSLFKQANVSPQTLHSLLKQQPKTKPLSHVYPGEQLSFVKSPKGDLTRLEYRESTLVQHHFLHTDKGFKYELVQREPTIKLVRAEGVIQQSLYMAGKRAKLDDRLIMKMADIFDWDIDFALDIRKNDKFTLLFEEKYLDGKKLGTGNIIAAEFINKGKSYRAVRYTDTQGVTQYYSPEGEILRKAFLRSPIEFARISSHFSLNRKHPVLHTFRAHKGTDYAAPRGTPIRAIGAGKVVLAGKKGGYGNTLIIQHNGVYKTLYAHLNGYAKGIRQGSSVQQGQIIGYVGSTGLATGPHLHFELHVNNVQRNFVTADLPRAMPIAGSEKARFKAKANSLIAKLESNKTDSTQVAAKDSSNTTL
jgi:murein DD-endopeptidase MepM/ murein hydrolase activator NlpD